VFLLFVFLIGSHQYNVRKRNVNCVNERKSSKWASDDDSIFYVVVKKCVNQSFAGRSCG